MAVYDTFTFFNELDLLEIRMNILNDVIDYFVIVESNVTFSGIEKPLYFKENKERYKRFQDKIIHIVVDDTPETDNPWEREFWHRNAIMRGLKNCNNNDYIIVSDLDEIPDPKSIITAKKILDRKKANCVQFDLLMCNYYFNYLDLTSIYWGAPRIVKYSFFSTKFEKTQSVNGEGITDEGYPVPQALRKFKWDYRIPSAGWHFSYLGGIDAVIEKVRSYAHQEYNNDDYSNKERIKALVEKGDGLFGRDKNHFGVMPTYMLPQYIRKKKEFYKKYFFDSQTEYKKSFVFFAIIIIKRIIGHNYLLTMIWNDK